MISINREPTRSENDLPAKAKSVVEIVEFFRQCFSHIPDFSANETVIVGDSLTSDIQGGCNVGIQSVWFNPHNLLNDTPIRPDFEIQTLQELPKILQHL